MKNRNRICQTLLLALAIGFTGLAGAQEEEEKTYTVNFEDTDIQKVIRFVADATDKTIIIDPKVRGQIKVISSKPVNSEELYELFLSILDIHGFTAVESGNVVRIVANRDARSLAVPTGLQVPAPGERADGAGEPQAATPRVNDT